MLGRFSPELPDYLLLSNPIFALRKIDGSSPKTTRWILRHGLCDANVLMGFIRQTDPMFFHAASEAGLITIGDQMIAPTTIEAGLGKKEQKRWPDWSNGIAGPSSRKIALEQQAWPALNHITCASDFVRNSLIECGVSEEKVSVLPYPIAPEDYEFTERQTHHEPPIVGFVGTVNLRKGTPYFLQVAQRFQNTNVRFVMVGPIHIHEKRLAEYGKNVEFIGAVPRQQVKDWLKRFDLFYFPSTCEGSAGALVEAMATGLPVVTSPNSGTIARDGVEGFVIPYDDVDLAEQRIYQLIKNSDLRFEMAHAARKRVKEFTIESYGQRLGNLIHHILVKKQMDKNR